MTGGSEVALELLAAGGLRGGCGTGGLAALGNTLSVREVLWVILNPTILELFMLVTLGPRVRPGGHRLHFLPPMPGLHTHWPVICSQSSRMEPNKEHPQAGGMGKAQ